MRTQLGLGLFAIAAVLVAGVAYWAIRENALVAPPQSPNPPNQVAEAPAPPVQSPPISATPPPSSPSPDSAASGPTTSANPSAAPSSSSVPSAQGQSPSPASSAALASAMPAEEQMSAANRQQIQEALHRRGYYDGPADGIFGPKTRAAIRRFQESIGEKGTGHLSAAEANRLVGPS